MDTSFPFVSVVLTKVGILYQHIVQYIVYGYRANTMLISSIFPLSPPLTPPYTAAEAPGHSELILTQFLLQFVNVSNLFWGKPDCQYEIYGTSVYKIIAERFGPRYYYIQILE